MSFNPESLGTTNAEQADEIPQQVEKPEAVIDKDITRLSNGDILASARIVDEAGVENFYNAKISQNGEQPEVTVNGQRTVDHETVQGVLELLDMSQDVMSSQELDTSVGEGTASWAVSSASERAKDDVNRQLRSQNPDVAVDETIVRRRTDEAVATAELNDGDDIDQNIIDFVNRATERESNRRVILAEQLIKDDSVDALAQALHDTGDASGAAKMEQYTYSVENATDGRKNSDTTRLEELGKRIERAMAETGKGTQELKEDAEELDKVA